MNIINMCFHRCKSIGFVIVDDAFSKNGTFVYYVSISLLSLTNDTTQHLRVHKINMYVVIHHKKIPTCIHHVMWLP